MILHCFQFAAAGFSVSNDFNASSFKMLRQTHSSNGFILEDRAGDEGDWLATYREGEGIAVKVADCTAILMEGESTKGRFVAAIHAGWRGTALNIVSTALDRLKPIRDLRCWLSPSICQSHFEVGGDVLEALDAKAGSFTKKSSVSGKWLLDLKGLQVQMLKEVAPNDSQFFSSPLCTFCQPEFFSYRQAKAQLPAGHRHYAWIKLLR